MKRIVAFLGLLGAAVAGLIVWSNLTRLTPEQREAKYGLEALAAMEQAWQAHKNRPMSIDPAQFDVLAADLRRIDLTGVPGDVSRLHGQFIDFTRESPKFFRQLFGGPPEQENAPGTRMRPANEQWTLQVRNAGIQLENRLKRIQEEIDRLRAECQRVLRG